MESTTSVGIEESKELLGLLPETASLMRSFVDDGPIKLLIKVPKFARKAKAAVAGISKVPSELKDLDKTELAELATLGLVGVKELYSAGVYVWEHLATK